MLTVLNQFCCLTTCLYASVVASIIANSHFSLWLNSSSIAIFRMTTDEWQIVWDYYQTSNGNQRYTHNKTIAISVILQTIRLCSKSRHATASVESAFVNFSIDNAIVIPLIWLIYCLKMYGQSPELLTGKNGQLWAMKERATVVISNRYVRTGWPEAPVVQ